MFSTLLLLAEQRRSIWWYQFACKGRYAII